MSLYSDEIRAFIHSRNWPKGLKIDIAERQTEDDWYLQFILYRENFEAFDGEDKLHIAMTVKEVMEKVRADGIPIYMEVAKDGSGA